MGEQEPEWVDRYSAASGLASAIHDCAARHGFAIAPICEALGLDSSTFSDVTGRISLDKLCRLLETCALISKDECFGLNCIDFFQPGATGPYGYGLMAAPTALDFMRFVGENQDYVSGKSHSHFLLGPAFAEIQFTYAPQILKRDQYVDMGVGLLMQRLRSIIGIHIDSVEVGLERPKPKHVAPYREKISRRISFGQQTNSIRLPSALFGIRNRAGDERLFRLMDLQCRSLRPDQLASDDLADRLKAYISERISDRTISLSEAAASFNVSERSLQRRLSELGTSLAEIRDEVRRDLASRLLRESDLSAAEIADRLGYSASSALTRSAMRWFGATPRAYRKA